VLAHVEGRGAVTLDQLLALARIVSATRNLHRTVAAARRRVLVQPLADWMRVDPANRRLQRALTMWAAVTASTYVSALNMPEGYRSQGDSQLRQRMIAYLSESFGDVMGVDPSRPE